VLSDLTQPCLVGLCLAFICEFVWQWMLWRTAGRERRPRASTDASNHRALLHRPGLAALALSIF